jgi:hypothetical protein
VRGEAAKGLVVRRTLFCAGSGRCRELHSRMLCNGLGTIELASRQEVQGRRVMVSLFNGCESGGGGGCRGRSDRQGTDEEGATVVTKGAAGVLQLQWLRGRKRERRGCNGKMEWRISKERYGWRRG